MEKVVCFAATKNYYNYVEVAIYSLLENNPNIDKVYCIIEDDKIDNFFNTEKVYFININNYKDRDWMVKPSSPNYNTRFSTMSFIRLYLSEILDEDIVFYLDTDIIVNQNIEDVFNIRLENWYLVAAMPESGFEGVQRVSKNIDFFGGPYFNSGVLLMNLKLIRQMNLIKDFIFLLNNVELEYVDQDILNHCCYGRVYFLQKEYNAHFITGNFFGVNPKIIHYVCDTKPWDHPEGFWFSELWWYYKARLDYYKACIKETIVGE